MLNGVGSRGPARLGGATDARLGRGEEGSPFSKTDVDTGPGEDRIEGVGEGVG